MSFNSRKTSAAVAHLAAETLKDSNASAPARDLAASALLQRDGGKQTGAEMESKAARVLDSSKYGEDTKRLAGAVLAQANRER